MASRTGVGAAIPNGQGQNRDMVEGLTSEAFRDLNRRGPEEFRRRVLQNESASSNHDEQTQANTPVSPPLSSEHEMLEQSQLISTPHRHGDPAHRPSEPPQLRTMPRAARTDATMSSSPDSLSQPLLGASNRSPPNLARVGPAHRRPPPVPARIRRYTALSASQIADSECAICQSIYDQDQHIAIQLISTPCAHVFGLSCLQQWVNSGFTNSWKGSQNGNKRMWNPIKRLRKRRMQRHKHKREAECMRALYENSTIFLSSFLWQRQRQSTLSDIK
ncbi:hypothetical protein G6011_06971 [Alternaria panax]|uniref:RING-type domain-containing protein n=1 Tax=Alternaria panax TaxID=48097 RepID=A0AAD4I1K2_9PLEO|nr:hypothetical protein G6011_06971 [Alternaria panax]